MTEAETILQMIETVSPDDTAKLDEIDARVWCYLNGHTFTEFGLGAQFFYTHKDGYKTQTVDWRLSVLEYTRSRDALKAIRPEGWLYYAGVNTHTGMKSATMVLPFPERGISVTKNAQLATEELAELHAIIQAIAYERSQKG